MVVQVSRLCNGPNSVDKFVKLINEELINYHDVQVLKCPYFNNGIINKVKNIFWFRKLKGDTFYLTGDNSYLMILPTRKKVLLTILDVGMSKNKFSLGRLIYELIYFRLPIKFSKRVVSISDKTREDLKKFCKKDYNKITTIHVPLDPKYENKDLTYLFITYKIGKK